MTVTRRSAIFAYGLFVAASRSARAQQLAGEPAGRIPPVDELVNASEFRAIAERKLDGLPVSNHFLALLRFS